MKRLNLDETWKLCLQVHRHIAKKIKENSRLDAYDLKNTWLVGHKKYKWIHHGCFFCEYTYQHFGVDNHNGIDCKCPAKKIDKTFDCFTEAYRYNRRPVAFYKELVRLNKIRLAKKK